MRGLHRRGGVRGTPPSNVPHAVACSRRRVLPSLVRPAHLGTVGSCLSEVSVGCGVSRESADRSSPSVGLISGLRCGDRLGLSVASHELACVSGRARARVRLAHWLLVRCVASVSTCMPTWASRCGGVGSGAVAASCSARKAAVAPWFVAALAAASASRAVSIASTASFHVVEPVAAG